MFCEKIKIFTGLVLMQDHKILFVKNKKSGIWTIPFAQVKTKENPQNILQQLAENFLNIQIEENSLIQKLVINKVNEAKEPSVGYFSMLIDRKGEPKISNESNYSELSWFEKKSLPVNLTPDLQKILDGVLSGQKFLEIVE